MQKKQVEDVKFIKKVLLHTRKRLERKSTELDNYSELAKKSRNDDAMFIKQVPVYPRDSSKKN